MLGIYSTGVYAFMQLLILMAILTVVPVTCQTCYVIQMGAKGDNRSDDTASIQKALDTCNTVVFSQPSIFLAKPLHLTRSNSTLIIEPGATLTVWRDTSTWQGTPGFLYGSGLNGLVIDGKGGVNGQGGGVIDGQGWRWWAKSTGLVTINLWNVNNVHITGLQIIDSSMFNVQVRGVNMRVENMGIMVNAIGGCNGNAPNTDGINVGGRNIYVGNSKVHNRDDCVPVNADSNVPGSPFTSDVIVENMICECGTNGGVVIVGDRNALIQNVVFRNMAIEQTNQGAGVKVTSNDPKKDVTGSMVKNVRWQAIKIRNPRASPLYINAFNQDSFTCSPVNPASTQLLSATGVTFQDFIVEYGSESKIKPAGCFICGSSRPCTGLAVSNVQVKGADPYVCGNAPPKFDNSSPASCVPPH